MRTIEVKLYKYSELSEDAQETARNNFRDLDSFSWGSEYHESLAAFCNHFNVKLKDWSIGTCSYSYVETDADNSHFRGKKLRDFDRDNMPTGFCADCALWMTFYDEFKRTGDALAAFNEAIEAWVKSYVSDMEDAESDERIAENIECNEDEFDENGVMQ